MLVTKDILRHLLTTVQPDGTQKVESTEVRNFQISLCLIMGLYVIFAIPTAKDELRNRNLFCAFTFTYSVALAIS